MSLKGRAAVVLLKAMQKVLNKDVNIPQMQEKYNANKERVLRIHITDAAMYANFKISGGRVQMVTTDHPNATVSMGLDTLLKLIEGKVVIREQDGFEHYETYTPFDAWRRGDLVVMTANPDEGWLSDLTLFGKEIYQEAFPALKKELAMGGLKFR